MLHPRRFLLVIPISVLKHATSNRSPQHAVDHVERGGDGLVPVAPAFGVVGGFVPLVPGNRATDSIPAGEDAAFGWRRAVSAAAVSDGRACGVSRAARGAGECVCT